MRNHQSLAAYAHQTKMRRKRARRANHAALGPTPRTGKSFRPWRWTLTNKLGWLRSHRAR